MKHEVVGKPPPYPINAVILWEVIERFSEIVMPPKKH